MICTIDIKCNAANPNMPIKQFVSFKGSPSSIRVLDVPKKIEKWNITNVYVQVKYPDGTTISKECVRNGCVWVGTVDGTNTIGTSKKGFSIVADGIDENGDAVLGYVLGVGDVIIMDSDGIITPGETTWSIHLYDEEPENPKKGDAYFENETFKIYDGTQWKSVGGVQSYIEMDDKRIYANGDIFINDEGEWRKDAWLIDSDEFIASLVPSSQNVRPRIQRFAYMDGYVPSRQGPMDFYWRGEDGEWESDRWIYPNSPISDRQYYIRIGRTKIINGSRLVSIQVWYKDASGNHLETNKNFSASIFYSSFYLRPNYQGQDVSTVECTVNGAGYWNVARLASLADLPQKVGELENDVGYATTSDVETKVGEVDQKLSNYMPLSGSDSLKNWKISYVSQGKTKTLKWDGRMGELELTNGYLWCGNDTEINLENSWEQIKLYSESLRQTLPEYITSMIDASIGNVLTTEDF